MTMKQIGAAVLNPGTTDETWGYCESTDIGHEGEKKEIANGDGDTVGLLYTNTGKKKFSGTYTPLATAGTPVTEDDLVGSELLVNPTGTATLTIYIDSASFKRKKGDVSEFTIEGYYYPSVVATPVGG